MNLTVSQRLFGLLFIVFNEGPKFEMKRFNYLLCVFAVYSVY